MRTDRIEFLDLYFDRLSFEDLRDRLASTRSERPYGYVVTPNVDHVVRAHREPELRELYAAAEICVCDSRILKLLGRLSGIDLPLVLGSDLTAALFASVIKSGDRVAVVGADNRCIDQLRTKFPAIEFLHFDAPRGLRTNSTARASAAAFIASCKARFTFIAVGSPQQEMIARQAKLMPGASGLALCIGAGLDFIVGKQKRAPRLLQLLGLEWAHRLGTNPQRLWRRYLVEDVRIFPIWLRRYGPRRKVLIPCILAVGLAVLAIGLYGRFLSRPPQSGRAFETEPLPPAQSIAAVRALPPPNLLKPVSVEQATKENSDRPFVGRPDSPAPRFVLHTDTADRDRAVTCLAQAAYYEAAGEGVDGQRAVAQIVLNRVHHPGFPSTVCGVVYQGGDRPTGCQFSFVCDGSLQRVPIPWLWARSRQIAEAALAGKVFAPVGHATHYHADYVLPYWADSLDKSVKIGRHIFYRLRGGIGDAVGFSQRYGGTEPPFREPGAAVILPQTAETAALANTLTTDAVRSAPTEVAKAGPVPNAALVVDSNHGTLLIDGASVPKGKSHSASTNCATSGDRKQLSPLRADDMRATSSSGAC